jgi:hypothetical protein
MGKREHLQQVSRQKASVEAFANDEEYSGSDEIEPTIRSANTHAGACSEAKDFWESTFQSSSLRRLRARYHR